MSTQPLFDMSQAKPIQSAAPLFDMSQAKPITPASAKPDLVQQARDAYTARHGKVENPGVAEGAGLAGGLAEWDKASGGEIIGGLKDLFSGNVSKGLHRIITGGGAAMAPAAPFAAVAAPAASVLAGTAGAGGGYLANRGATALGATPDQAALAGDLGALAAGAAGGATPSLVRSAGKLLLAKAGSAATAAGEALDPDIIGLVSPRLAHALRLSSKAGKVATKLGEDAFDATATNTPYAGESQPPATPSYPTAADLHGGLKRLSDLSGDLPPVTPAGGAGAASPMAPRTPAGEAPAPVIPAKPTLASLGPQLDQALGAKPLEPNVPLRLQGKAPALPEGFTPTESSVLRGYKYDPETQELEGITKTGQRYRTGEVTPEQFQKFEAADSKGTAWNELRKNATPLGKYVGGKFQPYPRKGLRSATPEPAETDAKAQAAAAASGSYDLTSLLEQSLQRARKLKDLQ